MKKASRTNASVTTVHSPRTRRSFGTRFGLTTCLLGAALMSCTLEAGTDDEFSDAEQVEAPIVVNVILQKVEQQKQKEASLLQKILPPEMIQAFDLAKEASSVYTNVTNVIDAVKTVGRLIGVLPPENAVEALMLSQLAAIRSDIADLHGSVLGAAYTANLRDVVLTTTQGVSASQQARDFVAANNRAMPEATAQAVLLQSLNTANVFSTDAIAREAAFFQRLFHGKNGVDDQNLGNTSGEWKEVIATPNISNGNNTVWDWRLGLPALAEAITARVQVLAAVYPDFIRTGRFRDELLRYRSALGAVQTKIRNNIGCNFSIYQHAFTDSAPDYVFDLRAICVDPFTGIAQVVSATEVLPGVPAKCAAHWPGGAPSVCVCTSCATLRNRVSQNRLPNTERTVLMNEFRQVPAFKAVLDYGLADARAALIRKLGLFEVQSQMDRLYTMAMNHPGPLSAERLLPRKDPPNSCAQADSQSRLVLANCYTFHLIQVPTPGGTIFIDQRTPIAQPWRYIPITGEFVYSDGRCMDVANGSSRVGTRVQLWSCNGTDAQRWSFDPETKRIRSATGTTLDLQVVSAAAGTPLLTWSEGSWESQRWGQ